MLLRSGKKQVIKWTAEGAVKCAEAQSILQRVAYVSCRGYAGILLRAREFPVNQGGTAD